MRKVNYIFISYLFLFLYPQIFETDVHEWPQQNHNFTPVLIEEFVMKTMRQNKQHYTRIALFQIHGTLFYWGRMYEDKDHKEGIWNFKNFQ